MKKTTKKTVNVQQAKLLEMLKQCKTWPEFNIKLVMNGYELDNDMLIGLIHAAFYFADGWSLWQIASATVKELDAMTENARQILVGACEDDDCKFTDQMIDTILKRTIFDMSTLQFKIPDELHKRILFGAIKKNPAAFKAAYERYQTFAKYKV